MTFFVQFAEKIRTILAVAMRGAASGAPNSRRARYFTPGRHR